MSSARAILDAWDLASEVSPARRPVALLASLSRNRSEEELLGLSVGACDAELLRARAALLGNELCAWSPCPACGQEMEFSVSTPELLGLPAPRPMNELRWGEFVLRFRLPTYRDVIAASTSEDIETVRRRLLRACLTVVSSPDGATTDPAHLADEAIERVGDAMLKADPHADLQLTLRCDSCSRHWQEKLDVAAYMGAELEVLARRLLEEVHTLAARYGWSESEILEMTPRRRDAYLHLGDG